MTKTLYVQNELQKSIFTGALLSALASGELGNGEVWKDVTVEVGQNIVGTYGFTSPQKYQFSSKPAFNVIKMDLAGVLTSNNIGITEAKIELKRIATLLEIQVDSEKRPAFRVASQVQKVLLEQFLIPQMKNGFWKNVRPANNHRAWEGVDIVVSSNTLGPIGFIIPCNYDFVNPALLAEHKDTILAIAQTVNPDITMKLIKRELIALSRIAGRRLKAVGGEIIKLNRGSKQMITTKQTLGNVVTRKVAAVFAEPEPELV